MFLGDFRLITHAVIRLMTVLVVLATGAALPVSAQSPTVTIESASLSVWPEYDDPGILVILAGSLAGDVSLPLTVAIPVPQGARNIQATVSDAAGLLSQAWEVENGLLTYTLPQPDFQVEYYVDRPPSNTERELAYTFVAPYDIGSLKISVQQPARSSEFSIVPEPDGTYQGNDGLTYHQLSRSDVTAGEHIDLTIRYNKTDEVLSAPRVNQDPAAATVPAPSTAASGAAWLPWLLIGLGGAVLVVATTYWLLQQQRSRITALPARAGRSRTALRQQTPKSKGGAVTFCAKCGRRFGPGDQYCGQCGAARER